MTETRNQRGERDAAEQHRREQGYEERDAPLRPILIAMACFGGLMLAGLTLPALVFRWDGGAPAPARPFAQPPPPRLLADPRGQRVRIDAAQRRALEGGPEPIDRAMQVVARRGWKDDDGEKP